MTLFQPKKKGDSQPFSSHVHGRPVENWSGELAVSEVDISGRLKKLGKSLDSKEIALLSEYHRDGSILSVHIIGQFCKRCRKAGVWARSELYATINNAQYGFDQSASFSPGGRDGIFRLTREYRPKNAMMKKLFDQFLDKSGSAAQEIADHFNVPKAELIPVRLVSHHMRLLGVLVSLDHHAHLVLVDVDQS